MEGPFAVELEDGPVVGDGAGEAAGGDDVLAGVVAFGGAGPEEEAVVEGCLVRIRESEGCCVEGSVGLADGLESAHLRSWLRCISVTRIRGWGSSSAAIRLTAKQSLKSSSRSPRDA